MMPIYSSTFGQMGINGKHVYPKGPSTKDVRQNLGFSNHHPSPCPGVSEFPKPPPLPGRPRPDFSINYTFFKFYTFLFLLIKTKFIAQFLFL